MKRAFLLIGTLFVFGCYHATIETGLPASNESINKPWASGWIYGLVPPSTVAAASQCPHGVARVETVHSFLNQLVGALTLGIYTPMSIKVTCASDSSGEIPDTGADIFVSEDATQADIQQGLQLAAQLAKNEQRPVYVQF